MVSFAQEIKSEPSNPNLLFMNSLVCISFLFGLCTRAHLKRWHAWLNVRCCSCRDAKQQRRGRLSANVSSVETTGGRDPSRRERSVSTAAAGIYFYFRGWGDMLPCASWQPACRRLDTTAANAQGGNVKPWRKHSGRAAQAKQNNFVSSHSAEFEKLFITVDHSAPTSTRELLSAFPLKSLI